MYQLSMNGSFCSFAFGAIDIAIFLIDGKDEVFEGSPDSLQAIKQNC
ncbi:TPA: hypothetical protein KZI01_000601 [Listeria monocytogenes]|nr:hypothetical protein [Listeria monocytogenes]HBI2138439.1 hypothetical protein [Listeria monocytogenes]